VEGHYHRAVLARALAGRVSSGALAAITAANLGQDSVIGLLRPRLHFDNSLFREGLAYIEACRDEAARARSPAGAWAAFGRLSHTAQDFYSHSNYVHLWLERYPAGSPPEPAAIEGLEPALLRDPRLRSGQIYWLIDIPYFIRPLRRLAVRLAPADSHARMNLDSPAAGPLFPYSIEAALQRTVAEYERTRAAIGETQGEAAMRAFGS
jgi:hypothetical protein